MIRYLKINKLTKYIKINKLLMYKISSYIRLVIKYINKWI